MICVLQRVSSARVRVGERTVGAIERGLLALVAVVPDDDEGDAAWLAERLCRLRVFADDEERMNLSVQDVGGALLLVSQFTLAADTRRGLRPSVSGAAAPERAEELFDALVGAARRSGVAVETGAFGAAMQVELVNDGPVTLIVDSAARAGRQGR